MFNAHQTCNTCGFVLNCNKECTRCIELKKWYTINETEENITLTYRYYNTCIIMKKNMIVLNNYNTTMNIVLSNNLEEKYFPGNNEIPNTDNDHVPQQVVLQPANTTIYSQKIKKIIKQIYSKLQLFANITEP